VRVGPSPTVSTSLQWGRRKLAADTRVHDPQLPVRLGASMGPPLENGGNRPDLARSNRPHGPASMRPPQTSGGNDADRGVSLVRCRASMGPPQ